MDSPAGKYNTNSASVRRLMKECKEMAEDPSTLYTARPLDVRHRIQLYIGPVCIMVSSDPSQGSAEAQKRIHKLMSHSLTFALLQDNLFEWHFTIRGPKDTEFEGGVYHGRILFPSDYPYRPPDIVFLTVRKPHRFPCPLLLLLHVFVSSSTNGSVCIRKTVALSWRRRSV